MASKTHIPPKPIRDVKAAMVLKNLSLREVSNRAKVHYNTASAILRGRIIHPEAFQRLATVVQNAPELVGI